MIEGGVDPLGSQTDVRRGSAARRMMGSFPTVAGDARCNRDAGGDDNGS
jgi:hypothetical protein